MKFEGKVIHRENRRLLNLSGRSRGLSIPHDYIPNLKKMEVSIVDSDAGRFLVVRLWVVGKI